MDQMQEAIISAYRARKREYENAGKTDHAEYAKFCEWLSRLEGTNNGGRAGHSSAVDVVVNGGCSPAPINTGNRENAENS